MSTCSWLDLGNTNLARISTSDAQKSSRALLQLALGHMCLLSKPSTALYVKFLPAMWEPFKVPRSHLMSHTTHYTRIG